MIVRLHLQKKAIRCFGVAESFRKGVLAASVLSGVVMRADFIVDGIIFGKATLGGDDATESIRGMFEGMKRKDINVIMVSGSIVSLFNIVDVDGLHESLNIPVISLTYRPSEGLEEHLKRHFADEPSKLEAYRRLGERHQITLHTGKRVYVRCAGISDEDATTVVNRFTLQGSLPEPIRFARLLSKAALNFLSSGHV